MSQSHTEIYHGLIGVDSKGLSGFVTCSINYSYYGILGGIMGTRAWGQGLQGAFWQPHSPERAEPCTEQPGPVRSQPTLQHGVLGAVPRSLEKGLALCRLPICTNPRRRNLRTSTGIAWLVFQAGMPRAQHPYLPDKQGLPDNTFSPLLIY